MHILILLLITCCVIVAFFSVRPSSDGHAWLKWDTKRKTNYISRFSSGLKRKGKVVKNPPLYYTAELDRFYIKDDANLDYNVSNALTNLIRVHEQ